MARTEILLRIESEAVKQTIQGSHPLSPFWAERVTEEKFDKYIDHDLKKVVPAVMEAKGAATQF